MTIETTIGPVETITLADAEITVVATQNEKRVSAVCDGWSWSVLPNGETYPAVSDSVYHYHRWLDLPSGWHLHAYRAGGDCRYLVTDKSGRRVSAEALYEMAIIAASWDVLSA